MVLNPPQTLPNSPWPQSAKTFVCCDVTSSLNAVWVPWTVAGSLSLALCVLASIRVVTSTLRPVGRAGKRGTKAADSVEVAVVEAAGGKDGCVEMVGVGGGADAAGGVAGAAAEP